MRYVLSVEYACVILFAGMAMSQAAGFPVGDILIDHPWARSLPAVSKNGAVYMTLRNDGTGADSLVSASTPVADRTEIHTHIHESGMMMMRQIEKIELIAGAEARLEPGGLHLMLFGIYSPMTEGKQFPMSLRFENAGDVEVMVSVGQPPG